MYSLYLIGISYGFPDAWFVRDSSPLHDGDRDFRPPLGYPTPDSVMLWHCLALHGRQVPLEEKSFLIQSQCQLLPGPGLIDVCGELQREAVRVAGQLFRFVFCLSRLRRKVDGREYQGGRGYPVSLPGGVQGVIVFFGSQMRLNSENGS